MGRFDSTILSERFQNLIKNTVNAEQKLSTLPHKQDLSLSWLGTGGVKLVLWA
jgi:hypothetical protein